MVLKNKGFTLVELLIVMAIVIVLATIMVGTFNAIGITNRGRDAQRKKDLNRIKIAFEEYFNDKGYFPKEDLVTEFNNKNNCQKNIEDFPYLKPWPCDPNGEPYLTFAEIGNKFRIITNLENKKDRDIPSGWYDRTDFLFMGLTKNDVNYGVSSSNILWYEQLPIDTICDITFCAQSGQNGDCTAINYCSGSDGNCYYYTPGECNPVCKVAPGYSCPR